VGAPTVVFKKHINNYLRRSHLIAPSPIFLEHGELPNIEA